MSIKWQYWTSYKVLVNISHSKQTEENTFTLTATDKLSKK